MGSSAASGKSAAVQAVRPFGHCANTYYYAQWQTFKSCSRLTTQIFLTTLVSADSNKVGVISVHKENNCDTGSCAKGTLTVAEGVNTGNMLGSGPAVLLSTSAGELGTNKDS